MKRRQKPKTVESIRTRLKLTREPIFLVDGSSFLYRAFYAYPDLKRADGFPTNAIYIVLRMLFKIIKEESPKFLGFFLDGKGPTFRHELFEPYKANRLKMPENLALQIEPLLQGVRSLGLMTKVLEGVEADDCIASLTHRFKQDYPIVIVGSDKDLWQLLDKNVFVWDPGQKKEKLITLETFVAQQGLKPEQWPDFQALVGDKVDNIPGVPGVGPKTALALLKDFPSLEELRAGHDRLKPKMAEKLRPHLDDLLSYRQLTRLKTDCCQEIELEDLKCGQIDTDALISYLKEYEFKSLLKEVPGAARSEFLDSRVRVRENTIKLPINSSTPQQLNPSTTFRNQEVGLFFEQNRWFLGVDSKELEFSESAGSLSQLVASLQGAQIFVPSLKDLLLKDKIWFDLPTSSFFDLSLSAYLLNPEERNYSWKRLYQAFAGEIEVSEESKGLATLKMGQVLRTRIAQASLDQLMQELETPLVPVLVKMEQKGIRIDLHAFKEFLAEVKEELAKLTEQIYAQAGKKFNIRSSQQLAEVLFHDLGLKSRRKTPKGAPSTSIAALQSLVGEHPIIELILKYRTLEKLRSTYLEPLPQKVDERQRLHTHFNQLATATGRLSSSEPNLQNIPIRGEFGPRMRSCFVAAPGKLLVAADYSQIELRILAHMSEDETLLEAFELGQDIHSRTAALLFDKPVEEVTPGERRKAKTINFGLLYGMGPQKLSRELGISLNEAKEFIQIYFSKLKKVQEFYDHIQKEAEKRGYVTTIAGRRRLLPEINSRNANVAGQARRMAINTVVQGSAADIIKKAMILVDKDEVLQKFKAYLILQVHDELILEVEKDYARDAGQRLSEIMSGVYTLKVPLVVDWGVGKNWGEAH
ncbi:DNA polymerase I [Desulfohalobiaceae bacterium Ax17]|uniref:DNA polymerase I n=1 Tax=Desulfovulcanus ferrireducens TaxID=2831190 RepID=UPI00207BBBA4|nr:DNA polymerase I [Desulfovulcanus ferrireducens]MBT8762753.1 DNA polymerase I [Desulfovulcanus ferrireducens]